MTLTANQQKAIRRLRFWLTQYAENGPFFLLDTETTGLKKWDEVVEIVILNWQSEIIFSSLVKPTQPISLVASSIHGLTDADVANAPTMLDLYPQIAQVFGLPAEYMPFVERATQVNIFAWNAAFDERMLHQSMQRHGKHNWTVDYPALMQHNWLDAQELYTLWVAEPAPFRSGGPWKYQSLDRARAEFNIDTGSAHRAEADARAMHAVLLKMLEIGEREGVADEEEDV
jgi:DNA polymerase-3 subunit epsilon